MRPQDIIWRVTERLEEQQRLLIDSRADLDPKKHADLLDALAECEQLNRTQLNVMRRIRRRYPD